MLQFLNLKHQKNKAFTLIELLVVVAIIAFLAVLTIFVVRDVRAKSRDSRRVADIKSIQEGLSLYYNNNYLYPDSGGGQIEIDGTTDAMSTALIGDGAMQGVPIDPLNEALDGVTYKYYYESLSGERDYQLIYYLETDSIQGKSQGQNIAVP
jgi:prepilin-type N-terminal cleavage/methylation domain-containing protein